MSEEGEGKLKFEIIFHSRISLRSALADNDDEQKHKAKQQQLEIENFLRMKEQEEKNPDTHKKEQQHSTHIQANEKQKEK